ncbi:MAG: hypothetical protein ACRDT4_04155, partial [Micromonosporaceae bacterium]
PELVGRARRLAARALEHGTVLPHTALQFPLRHPAVASVVSGMARPDHVRSSVDWMTTPVPDAFWEGVDTQTGPDTQIGTA